MELDYDSLYVGGEWITPASSSKTTVVSASTEQVIGHVPEAVEADIDAAVGAARRAFDDPNGWAHWQPAQRAAAMERLASALDKRAGEMVQRISSQNGMPVAVATQSEAVFRPCCGPTPEENSDGSHGSGSARSRWRLRPGEGPP